MTFVYFFQAGEQIKIGLSSAPRSRVKQLRRWVRQHNGDDDHAEMLLVMRGSWADEIEIHRQFAACHQGGEWFTATAELLEYIACHRTDAVPREDWPPWPRPPLPRRDPTAKTRSLARRLGRQGGLARARGMTPEERSLAARLAAQRRWAKASNE